MLAISMPFPRNSHVDIRMLRVRLCADDLELLLPCGRHDKYSGWKTKARINLWILAIRSDYLLFVRVCHHHFVCLIAIPTWIFMGLLWYATGRRNAILGQSHLQYNIYVKIQKMQQSHSLAQHEGTACSNVTRNRGGNRLEGKHTLMFVK